MPKANGGIIGSVNKPTGPSCSGVWTVQDVYNGRTGEFAEPSDNPSLRINLNASMFTLVGWTNNNVAQAIANTASGALWSQNGFYASSYTPYILIDLGTAIDVAEWAMYDYAGTTNMNGGFVLYYSDDNTTFNAVNADNPVDIIYGWNRWYANVGAYRYWKLAGTTSCVINSTWINAIAAYSRLKTNNRIIKRWDDNGTQCANCTGIIPTGNCLTNPTWVPSNGNWWTWGITGVTSTNCGNPGAYDFVGGTTSAFNACATYNVASGYSAYYTVGTALNGIVQKRDFINCNCGTIGNCFTNCNCNCNCQCGTCGSCLVKGTKIKTPDGVVSIESLKVGDFVLDSSNKPTKVLFTKEVEVGTRGVWNINKLVGCTGDHLWLTKYGWGCISTHQYTNERFEKSIDGMSIGCVLPDEVSTISRNTQLVSCDNKTITDLDIVWRPAEANEMVYGLFTESGDYVLENGLVSEGKTKKVV